MWNSEQIQSSFVAGNSYQAGIACLLSVLKLYNKPCPETLSRYAVETHPKPVTLSELKKMALESGMDAEIQLLQLQQLKESQTPVILFFENELKKKDFVLCYGFDEKRFIVGEPGWGLMQYFPQEIDAMWIEGICLVLSP